MKIPDSYIIIKVVIKENQDGVPPGTIYKLFSTWYGGYLGSDSWRLNSGITKVEKEDDSYLVYGSSSTVYKVYRNVGYSNYTYSVAQEMIENIPDYVSFEIIEDVDEVIKILESFIR